MNGAQIPGYQKQINAPSCGEVKVFTGDCDGNIKSRSVEYLDSDWDTFYTEWADHLLIGTPNPVSGEVGRRVVPSNPVEEKAYNTDLFTSSSRMAFLKACFSLRRSSQFSMFSFVR